MILSGSELNKMIRYRLAFRVRDSDSDASQQFRLKSISENWPSAHHGTHGPQMLRIFCASIQGGGEIATFIGVERNFQRIWRDISEGDRIAVVALPEASEGIWDDIILSVILTFGEYIELQQMALITGQPDTTPK